MDRDLHLSTQSSIVHFMFGIILAFLFGATSCGDSTAPPTGPPSTDLSALGGEIPPDPKGTEHAARTTRGIWITLDEIRALPRSGRAWDRLLEQANRPAGTPNLSNQDQMNNVYVLAKALVYARTGEQRYRTEVRQNCMAAINTELDGETLALGRELAAYVIAADLVGLETNEDVAFSNWLRRTLTENLAGRTLRSTHDDRPNNWGTMAGASRAAVAAYLGDEAELERAAKVFKGWLGDHNSYARFNWGDLSWQADSNRPVGINPRGATKQGHSIDGIVPDDMRRGGGFRFPPGTTNYPWEGLAGAVVQAEVLHRAGYPAWQWQDQALKRAVEALFALSRRYGGSWWVNDSDEQFIPWMINKRYGTQYPTNLPARPGKIMAWTDWTHSR
jgi:Alginate lyase